MASLVANNPQIDLEPALRRRVQELTAAPVFVVGSPRSGTTWLQRILLCHPQLCGGQESHFFSAASGFIYPFIAATSNRPVGLPAYWSEADIAAAMIELWQRTMLPLIERSPDAHFLIEKTPDHAICMASIIELLPAARFIHMIRDSRAVSASLMAASKGWGRNWAPKDAREAALCWGRHVSTARNEGQKVGPDRYTEIFYEDLAADAVGESTRIFKFIGVDVSPEQVENYVNSQRFDVQKASSGTPIPTVTQSGNKTEPEGFFRSGKPDSWRGDLSLYQKLVIWRFTRKLMAELGYNWAGRVRGAAGSP